MALDRRTLRELLARVLIDPVEHRATVVLVATGRACRQTLHGISVGVPGAQRRAEGHVVVAVADDELNIAGCGRLDTEVHLVAVSPDEGEHPVTTQLASRAQGIIAAPDHPRALQGLPRVRADNDVVAAYETLLHRVFERMRKQHDERRSSLPPEKGSDPTDALRPSGGEHDAPPSEGTRRCKLALLGVGGVTAQELLTALDTLMARRQYRRCAHAGGGRDFILLRGHTGAGLRVVADGSRGVSLLATELSTSLAQPVLVATTVGEQSFERARAHTLTHISWTLESVTATGVGVAYRDATTRSELAPQLPLDERICHFIAAEVFAIQPEADGIRIHYEHRA